MIVPLNWVIFRFQPFIFRGVQLVDFYGINVGKYTIPLES